MQAPCLSTLSSKGQVTIPKNLRESLRLKAGEVVLMKVVQRGIMLQKVEITTRGDDFDAGEWETLKKMAAGEGRTFASGKKLIASLK